MAQIVAQIGQGKNSLSSGVLLVAVHTGTVVDQARMAFPGSTRMVVSGSGHGGCGACGCHDMRNKMNPFKERAPRIIKMRAVN